MTDVFADSSYFLALLNPSDRDHARAKQLTRRGADRLVTTAWVFVEVANAMSRVELRHLFLRMYDSFGVRGDNIVVPAEQRWLERGLELFRARPDKNWSLTDSISFSVMQEFGIQSALTADNHFQQAGFRALLLE